MLKKNKTKGFVLVIIAALFWGYMGVPTKNLGDLHFDSFSVSFFRTSIAGFFYFLYCLKKNPSWLKSDKKGFLFFALYGIIAFGATFICYNASVNYISIALGTMFLFTSQIWVVTLSYFIFKEKLTIKKLISILLTLTGCFMMCKIYDINNIHLNIKGVILGLVSGFTFALQAILAKINSNKYNENTLLTYSFIFASICFIPFMDIKNTLHILKNSNNIYFIIKNILIIGALNTLVANSAYVKSIQYIEVGVASIVASSEIVIASIVAYFVFGQTLDTIQIIGMILIVFSIVLLEINLKNKKMRN